MQSNKIAIGKTNMAILNGTEDVRLWSDEELLRGQRRAKNGRWTGRPPTVVPLRQMTQALCARSPISTWTCAGSAMSSGNRSRTPVTE